MADSLELYDGNSLSTRQISGFALSIGTGLAFESLFPRKLSTYDPDRKIPNEVKVSDYQECWISLSTMFRNMASSVNKDTIVNTSEKELKDALETEIDVIQSLFMNEGNNLCKPIFYHCTYKNLRSKIPKQILLREDKTDGQMLYRQKHDAVMKLLMKSTDEIHEFDTEIRAASRTSAFILTHHPWDLVSYKNFSKLDLLESNTGRLKKRYTWSSKYYPVGGEDLSILPFSRKLLLVFGDRIQIHPSDMRLRRLIVETAKACKWTGVTSEAKVMQDLEGTIREPYVLQLLRNL